MLISVYFNDFKRSKSIVRPHNDKISLETYKRKTKKK